MKRSELYHPRVFDDPGWARSYFRSNKKNIQRTGRRLAALMQERGFRSGRILDAGCGFGAVAIETALQCPDMEIIGIDLSEPLLEIARMEAEKAGVASRVRFQKGDVYAIPFRPGEMRKGPFWWDFLVLETPPARADVSI